MEQHKTTPWKIGAMESGMVAIDSSDDQEVTGFIDPEDASRILACVNACAGISTENLEDDCFKKMREDRDMLMKQSDELLAEMLKAREEMSCANFNSAAERIDHAIASVKSGAA